MGFELEEGRGRLGWGRRWLVEEGMAKGWRFGMLVGSDARLEAVGLGRDREN